VLLSCVLTCAAADDKPNDNTISDLDYGVALFHYYQGDHQTALTEFAIIEHKGDIQHQGLSPQLVKGGMSLSYGLYDQANEIFDRVLKAQPAEKVKADAWFGSGKLQYLEGNWREAQTAFERVSDVLSDSHHDDFYYFQAQLALKEQDIERYKQFKSQISDDQPLHSYLSHNYLLQKIANDDLSSSELSQEFSRIDAQSIALADRSYLAMGYDFIEQSEQHAAITAFKQITLDSYLFEPALLGYGWALNNLAQYGQAKSLFGQLASRVDANYYVQEAILADAYASELLGDFETSLAILQLGITKFKQHQNSLEVMEQRLSVGSACYRAIILQQVAVNCDEKHQAFIDLALIEMLSDSQFSTKREQLQQVNDLSQQFKQQLEKLHTYQQMLTEKQRTAQTRLSDIKLSDLKGQVDNLSAKRDLLASRIDEAKRSKRSVFFLPQPLLARHDKITQASTKLENLKSKGQNVEVAEQRLDLIKRMFGWESDYNFTVNVHQTQHFLTQLDQHLSELKMMYQQLSQHVNEVANIDRELSAIDDLSRRITSQMSQSNNITERIEQAFSQQLTAYFKQRQHELNRSIVVAKLAIIRMQDASFSQGEQLPVTDLGSQ